MCVIFHLTNIKRGQTYVLSIDNNSALKSKFITKNIIFDKLNNYKTSFNTFTNKVKANDYAVILYRAQRFFVLV